MWRLPQDHVLPCTAPNAIDILYDEQVAAFKRAAISDMMWRVATSLAHMYIPMVVSRQWLAADSGSAGNRGWRMPQGGTHEPLWSLKYHLLDKH